MSLFISFYINRNSKRNYLSFIITYVKLSLFYLRLNSEPALTEYIFSNSDIMNYPYITGN